MANDSFKLTKARVDKKDEFYTMLTDIEKEMKYYKKQFEGKIIYCNCDDSSKSNFFKYFLLNFRELKLKKLISTCYEGENGRGCMTVYDGTGKSVSTEMKENGDFASDECLDILKQADIITTNPPFSLFRPFMSTLMNNNKKFIILGNMNAITCKDIFPYIKDGKLWFGKSIHSGDREFKVPQEYPLEAAGVRVDEEGNKYIRVKGVRWFTNMKSDTADELQTLCKAYSESEYSKYDQYDALNINKIADIPYDYDGKMGVPITIVDKICSDGMANFDTPLSETPVSKYRILNIDCQMEDSPCKGKRFSVNGKGTYARIIIQKTK